MKVRKVAGTCHDGTCPTVYVTDTGSVVVQGYAVSQADGLTLSEGEQAVDGLGLPEQDFWLFDDSIVVRLNFSEDGSLINIEQLEDAELATYLEWKDTAIRNAVPYADYVARAQRP
ncbi:MAG: hypothetical protein M3O70_23485 [Actinomycetota bacterium]|nr:hypothetical protein [Actinomycetota bacterium]